jgi:hypothetical protein
MGYGLWEKIKDKKRLWAIKEKKGRWAMGDKRLGYGPWAIGYGKK